MKNGEKHKRNMKIIKIENKIFGSKGIISNSKKKQKKKHIYHDKR